MEKCLTSRQKQSIATRNQIIQCATVLFTQMSYEKVTISDICKKANISVGAFYHHFKSKESILNEAYRLFDEELQEDWSRIKPGSTHEAIRFLIRKQLEAIGQNGPIYSTQFFKNQLTNEVKYILNKERFFYQTLLKNVQQAVENNEFHGQAAEVTDAILRLSRGTIYDWCLHEGHYDLIHQGLKDLDMVIAFYGYRRN